MWTGVSPIPESAPGMDMAQTLPFLPATTGDSWADKHPDLGLTNVSVPEEKDKVEAFKFCLKGSCGSEFKNWFKYWDFFYIISIYGSIILKLLF